MAAQSAIVSATPRICFKSPNRWVILAPTSGLKAGENLQDSSTKGANPPGRSGDPGPSSGSDIINFLTSFADAFLFSYSPKLRSLVAWSSNSDKVLGTRDMSIIRDGNLFLRHVHSDDRFAVMNLLEKGLSGTVPYRITYRWIRPDNNETRWLHCRGALDTAPDQALFQGLILDVTEEFAEGPVAGRTPDSAPVLFNAFPCMIVALDSDYRVVRSNFGGENTAFNFGDPHFSWKDFRPGCALLDCFSSVEHRRQMESSLQPVLEGRDRHYSRRIAMGAETYCLELTPLVSDGNPCGVLAIITDISVSVQNDARLADLQKADGFRQLAAGAAHNFNNSLQGILGHAATILNHPHDVRLVKSSSQSIVDSVSRSSQLTQQLLVADAYKRDLVVPLDLNFAVMAALNRIDDLFSSGFKISVTLGNLNQVLARYEQLVGVIETLILSARETSGAEGLMTISTSQLALEDNESHGLKSGAYVQLAVNIRAEDAPTPAARHGFILRNVERFGRRFQERRNRSTVMNDALVLVRSLGGNVNIESHPGFGTTYSLLLPVGDSEPLAGGHTQTLSSGPPEILVVDDDTMVLQTVTALLRDLGYSCLSAEDYRQALSSLRLHGDSIKVVLLDAVMPGMDGVTLLRKMKRYRESLKIISFSGAPPEYGKAMLEAGALQILRKPVDQATLKAAILSALDSREAA